MVFGVLFLIPISSVTVYAEQSPGAGTNPQTAEKESPRPSVKTNTQTTEEEILFENPPNKNKISGIFVRPAGAGPFPVVIFVHGSGNGDRNLYRPIANEFLKIGFASLLLDRPGCGKSTGDFRLELIDERLSETQAALQFIQSRNDIDKKRIGMWGISQAGEFIPQIAATGDIAFAILVSPGLNFQEDITYAASPKILAREKKFWSPILINHFGMSESDIDEAAEFATSLVQLLKKENVGYDEMLALLKERDSKPWFQKLCKTGLFKNTASYWTPEHFKRFYDLQLHRDSSQFLAKTRCPILVILGADDIMIDPVVNARRCAEAAFKAGAETITVKTFPDASHGITVPNGTPGGAYAAGYLDLMCSWLKKHCPEVRQMH